MGGCNTPVECYKLQMRETEFSTLQSSASGLLEFPIARFGGVLQVRTSNAFQLVGVLSILGLAIEIFPNFCYTFSMKTLYDVQQLLKQFGIIVYMGNRLYDIEMMQIELHRVYQAGLMDRLVYMEAELILRREHRLEIEYQRKKEK